MERDKLGHNYYDIPRGIVVNIQYIFSPFFLLLFFFFYFCLTFSSLFILPSPLFLPGLSFLFSGFWPDLKRVASRAGKFVLEFGNVFLNKWMYVNECDGEWCLCACGGKVMVFEVFQAPNYSWLDNPWILETQYVHWFCAVWIFLVGRAWTQKSDLA